MSAAPPPAPPTADAAAPASDWTSPLPRWARPGPQDPTGDPASYITRTLETAFAILIGIVLAVAVVHDVKRQVDINQRVAADKRSWYAFAVAHHQPLAVQQHTRVGVRLLLRGSTDFPCQPTGLTRAVARGQHRLCLMIAGPIVNGYRTVQGGYYIAASHEDRYINRYGCFGLPARRHLCGLSHAPAVTN